jgi:hypothetical protein
MKALKVSHPGFWARADEGAHALTAKEALQYEIEIVNAQSKTRLCRHWTIHGIVVFPFQWATPCKQGLVATSRPQVFDVEESIFIEEHGAFCSRLL